MKNQSRLGAFLTMVVALAATSAAAGTFTKIDMPGVAGTSPTAINSAGDIVGFYAQTQTSNFQGFLYSGGQFTAISVPGASFTIPLGINDQGQIVGYYQIAFGHHRGFLFDGQTYTDIQYPGSLSSIAHGINNAGQIVGSYTSMGFLHAFLLTNGVYTKIDPPETDFDGVWANGINDFGDVVGCYQASKGLFRFVGWELTQGIFEKIILPDSGSSCAYGINDSGAIVGQDDRGVYLKNKGAMMHQELRVPGAVYTQAGGINSLGQVVGAYNALSGRLFANHGFMWMP